MSSKFCETCGTPIEDGAKFCANCGKVTEVAPPPVSAPTPPPAAAPQQPQRQYTAPNTGYTPPPNQPNYQAQPNYYQQPVDNKPLSVGQYIGMMLLMLVPIANIIMPFVWAFGSGVNTNKKNYARALLIMWVIGIALSIVLSIALWGVFAAMFDQMGNGGGYYNEWSY